MRIIGLFLALAVAAMAAIVPVSSSAQVYISLSAPPMMQVEMQPQLSTPGSIWTPGYWAYGQQGYYWVGGSWTQPPQMGYNWTPGYWGYSQNRYNYNQGYWGPQVGYYGGINYGNGYFGNGYSGGGWYGNQYRYNTAVTRVNPAYVRNVYINRTVVVRNVNYTSYNGGLHGVRMHPDSRQIAYSQQHHVYATETQRQRAVHASQDRHAYAEANRAPVHTVAVKPAHAAAPVAHPPQQHAKTVAAQPQPKMKSGAPKNVNEAHAPKAAPNAKATHSPQ